MTKSNKTILVVDDDPTCLAAAKQTLQDLYHLLYATNGEDAIEAVQQHKPDLILLDLMLPGLNGYEVCEIIKSAPETADIPVIFLTSREALDDEEKALIAGGADYIRKPLQHLILRLRVRNQLSLVRLGKLEESHHDAIQMLSEAGHYNDTDTGQHIWRMAAYAAALAKHIGLPEDLINLIRMAAPMHDTGKIGTPDHILKKPGGLDSDEWVIMKQHAQIGYDILSKSRSTVFNAAAEIALYHHEKWDGSGYPKGLSGQDIPVTARVVAVADVFDALTTKRPYKEPWSVDEAFSYIENASGAHFDPKLVTAFLDIREEIIAIRDHYKVLEQAEL